MVSNFILSSVEPSAIKILLSGHLLFIFTNPLMKFDSTEQEIVFKSFTLIKK
jgi:hypothetical protein